MGAGVSGKRRTIAADLTAHRFKAEWIKRQHLDELGEWMPDRDEYGEAFFATFEAARAGAIKASRKAGAAEWVRIAEQQIVEGDDGCGFNWKRWETVQAWTGDYDGLDESL